MRPRSIDRGQPRLETQRRQRRRRRCGGEVEWQQMVGFTLDARRLGRGAQQQLNDLARRSTLRRRVQRQPDRARVHERRRRIRIKECRDRAGWRAVRGRHVQREP
eukprot:3134388-Prymnesium_polylepis.1